MTYRQAADIFGIGVDAPSREAIKRTYRNRLQPAALPSVRRSCQALD